jgi:hypothetical protein
MSRENRVNPGTYTQAGRLTPDDAAREMVKQRQSLSGSHGKGNPKARSEAWMHQASRARDTATNHQAAGSHTSAALLALAGAAICLSLYVAQRLAFAAWSRRTTSSVPATNHTPGSPYAHSV